MFWKQSKLQSIMFENNMKKQGEEKWSERAEKLERQRNEEKKKRDNKSEIVLKVEEA